MPKNDNPKDNGSPTPIRESRVDLFSPEWEKKTRVDFANSGRPLPESPLVTLKPHAPSDENPERESGKTTADSQG